MMKYMIFLLFTALPVFASDMSELNDTDRFIVKLLGVKAAEVEMRCQETVWENQPVLKLTFSTHTTRFVSRFFEVDNDYMMILKPSTFRILHFRKSTQQPGVVNQIQTEWIDEEVRYRNSSMVIPPDALNIFLLLWLMKTGAGHLQDTVLVEREGLLYDGYIKRTERSGSVQEYVLELAAAKESPDSSLVEHTDIFTWAVFKENAVRTIRVDIGRSKIEKCEFKFGLIKLTAEPEP